ncbi:phage tail sheath family protein [Flavobacterium jejuense]|uniref:Phage tail sheath family protein n=1 Tax=Flavobacterium jejuense TaxID=1544455 RepID=A0ABX0IKF8_9FLAO|nr:phage tail sheath C-terminal domain-containing protein [Flavobacterium jejuense]NHN24066.1 phage tail sheath family protein [Flavobacterium jejuense]
MSNFFTPDVYTEEIPLLPQSVAEVSTAVPAFIGYTEKATKEGKSLANKAIRISTLLEYKEFFGGAKSVSFDVTVASDETITNVKVESLQNKLYYAIELYFKNGGGDCYIVSIGSYSDTYNKQDFLNGLETLSKEDEPTLIMLGEATHLQEVDYYEVCQEALKQCADLKDRFCILDVQKNEGDAIEKFRNGIGANNLKYGAAYTPYLQTSLNYVYSDSDVNISSLSSSSESTLKFDYDNAITIIYKGDAEDNPKFKINKTGTSFGFSINDTKVLTISNVGEGKPVEEVLEAWNNFPDRGNFEILLITEGTTVKSTDLITLEKVTTSGETFKLDSKKGTALYSKIISELAKQRIILPPSVAVSGAYATTDRERGVWKAPANISLNGVVAPVEKITSKEQERLNVDATSGKSINAIRSFVGKGTMIWGARTLAGNDNEWRYVSVRRLFNMIEESTKKAAQFAVFESNDAITWLKVKAMIESFLYGVWQQGGLAGSVESQAYFVNIGLGKTMTQQDILEGKMIVEIGLAAVRPAEFIILKFSHKLQEA